MSDEPPPLLPERPIQSAQAPVGSPNFLGSSDGSYAVVEYDDAGAQVTLGRIKPTGGLFRAFRYDDKGHESVLATFQSLTQAKAAFQLLSGQGQGFQSDAGTRNVSWKWTIGCVIVAAIPVVLFLIFIFVVGSGLACLAGC